MARRNSFGSTRKLPSGRYQARYTGPDGVMRPAPVTFDTKGDAETWLAGIRTDIARGQWKSPELAKAEQESEHITLREYAEDWIRYRDLRPRTRTHYRKLLDKLILPTLGDLTLATITPSAVRRWHGQLETGPTYKAHAYGLLKSILGQAVDDDVLPSNPCRIKGASKAKRSKNIRPATVDELVALTMEMPDRLRLLIPLATFCSLRFGEITELRRHDVALKDNVLHIRRGVVRDNGAIIADQPKTDAGKRDVAIPPHLVPMIRQHLATHAQRGRGGLLFYGTKTETQLAHSSLLYHFNRAKAQIGRPDLTPHVLRHSGATLAAQAGATTRELQARLGHTTAAMAMQYQHVTDGRDVAIAQRMSELANASN